MVSKKRKFLDNYIDRYILCYHFRDVTTILVLFFNLLKTTLQMGLDKEITRTEFHDCATSAGNGFKSNFASAFEWQSKIKH